MEDVSKKWICPKLMGEGEVTQKFVGWGGGGVSKKNKEGTKFQRWARRL